MASGGISGIAVTITAVGVYLVYAGIRGVPLLEGARTLLKGHVPVGPPPGPVKPPAGWGPVAVPPPGGIGGKLVIEATRQLGKPYKWAAEGPAAFDCSGLVVWALRHSGYPNMKRLSTTGFLVWGGAVTIPRAQVQPGDLACWQGHMGIFVSPTTMIHAPNRRSVVKVGPVDGMGRGVLICRRVKPPGGK